MAVDKYFVAAPRTGAPVSADYSVIAMDTASPNSSYVIATSGNITQATAVAAALNATL